MTEREKLEANLRVEEKEAAEVRIILENPLFVSILDNIEAGHRKRWEKSAPNDTAGREESYWALRACRELRASLMMKIKRPEHTQQTLGQFMRTSFARRTK